MVANPDIPYSPAGLDQKCGEVVASKVWGLVCLVEGAIGLARMREWLN